MAIRFISEIFGPLTETSVRVSAAPRHEAYEVIAALDTAQSRKRLAFCGFLEPFPAAFPSNAPALPPPGKIPPTGPPSPWAPPTSKPGGPPSGVPPAAAFRPAAPPDF